MKVDIVMPKMGESLTEGTILKWIKKIGDKVERDETILEISTDKVDTEVPSPVAGILAEILAQENETIEVGKVIARIETDSNGVPEITSETSDEIIESDVSELAQMQIKDSELSGINRTENIVEVVMPKMGESLTEGTIVRWTKQVGETVERDETILEISTDKVDTEVPSPVAGILVEILAQENESVEVGKVIARISTSVEANVFKPKEGKIELTEADNKKVQTQSEQIQTEAVSIQSKPETKSSTFKIPRKSGSRFYSPLVRSIAEENNVTLKELDSIQGSGIDGRVNKNDLLQYIEKRKKMPAPPSLEVTAAKPLEASTIKSTAPRISETTVWGADDEIIPMDRVRQLIAEHMVYSKHTSAHVTSVTEADVTGIVKFREKYKDVFYKREGIKLTYTPFLTKAVIEGIKENPMVNVSVDGKNIIKHNRINMGMATALQDGNLIVPVIKNADALSITGLQRAITDLASRAREKKLNPDEIMDGTFTITNYGTAGTLFGSPIINQPQTAILGLGAIRKRPVAIEIDGEYVVAVRDMMYLSLSYDHRVIDGQLAGLTLNSIVRHLENMNDSTLIL